MPPAAALECERTGWTLDMIATVAPAWAAASAARWPARPAPMIRTSCDGMARESIQSRSPGVAAPGCRPFAAPAGRPRARRRSCERLLEQGSGRREARLQRPRDLLERHDAAQVALGVHGHQRALAAQRLAGQQRLERSVLANLALGRPRDAAHRQRAP